MKKLLFPVALLAICPLMAHAQLSQTFEAGEDTSNWGAAWIGGGTNATFLSESFGGLVAGDGSNNEGQSFSRSFKNNTAGVDLSHAYTMSLYVQVATYDLPSDGVFEIIDGDVGNGNAGDLRVVPTGTPGVFDWQARDNNSGWLDLGITLSLATPYHVVIVVNPADFTYSATVQLTDTDGNVLNTGSLTNLAFDHNVITNHQNGNLNFYIQASSGGVDAQVDNINIGGVPEPSVVALFGFGLAAILYCKRRWLAA